MFWSDRIGSCTFKKGQRSQCQEIGQCKQRGAGGAHGFLTVLKATCGSLLDVILSVSGQVELEWKTYMYFFFIVLTNKPAKRSIVEDTLFSCLLDNTQKTNKTHTLHKWDDTFRYAENTPEREYRQWVKLFARVSVKVPPISLFPALPHYGPCSSGTRCYHPDFLR